MPMNERLGEAQVRFPEQLLKELETSGPRYTSCPAADRLREPFDGAPGPTGRR